MISQLICMINNLHLNIYKTNLRLIMINYPPKKCRYCGAKVELVTGLKIYYNIAFESQFFLQMYKV